MAKSDTTLKKLIRLLDIAYKLKDDIAIIVVSNTKTQGTDSDNFGKFSLATEFFSEKEHEEIVMGFRNNGFYVQSHLNEFEFIKWAINGGVDKIKRKYKVVYNAANSGIGAGKKALVPSFCNLLKIPIIGSNPYVLAVCRHKFHCNLLLNKAGLPTPKAWYYSSDFQWLLNEKPDNGTIIIAKPTYESASFGIDEKSIFTYSKLIDKKIENLSKLFNQPITVQEFIPGYEVEVPVIINNFEPFSIQPIGLKAGKSNQLGQSILTYDVVYNDLYNFYNFNEFGSDFNKKITACAEDAVRILGTEGFGRIDFRVNSSQSFFIIDVSTYPHIVNHSSFRYLFESIGFKYSELFAILISITATKYKWV